MKKVKTFDEIEAQIVTLKIAIKAIEVECNRRLENFDTAEYEIYNTAISYFDAVLKELCSDQMVKVRRDLQEAIERDAKKWWYGGSNINRPLSAPQVLCKISLTPAEIIAAAKTRDVMVEEGDFKFSINSSRSGYGRFNYKAGSQPLLGDKEMKMFPSV